MYKRESGVSKASTSALSVPSDGDDNDNVSLPMKSSAATTTTTIVGDVEEYVDAEARKGKGKAAEDDQRYDEKANPNADALHNDDSVTTNGGEVDTRDYTLKRYPWQRNVTPWSAIISQTYEGEGTKEKPFVVRYVDSGEREDPYKWKTGYKWALTMMAATGMLAVTMTSSILSATIQSIKHEWPGHNQMMYIMVTGIYILGFVVGPFIWAPFSEVFGRRLCVMVSFIPFTAFNAAVCGSKSLNAMLVLRFFGGTLGCSSMTNSGATIADMFEARERGLAMGVFAAMPFLGPVIGPIVGGFLGPATSWKWVAAVTAFFALFITVSLILLLPETYSVVILRQRAARLTKVTGKLHLSHHDVEKPLNTKELMKRQFKVPFKLLFTEPIVFFLSLYMATVFAILYLQFTSFPIVFQQHRHWSPGIGALAFVPVAIGSNLGLVYLAAVVNPAYAKQHKAKGYLPPEARLQAAMIGCVLLPIGLMWFAWTCVPVSIHWIVPLLACVPYGAGIVLVFLACQNYLVDAYLPYAASVIAGGTVVRSVMGVILPLFTVDMYNALGVNWASALVAFIALLFTPVPFLLAAYGRRIRRLTKPGREADDLGLMIASMAAKKRAEAAAAEGKEVAAAGAPGPAAAEGELEQLEDEVSEQEEKEAESRYMTPLTTPPSATPMATTPPPTKPPTPRPRLEAGDEEMGIEGRERRSA